MTTLESIQYSCGEAIESINRRIADQLRSTNSLMSQVVLAQLRTKGKQLRPLMVVLCARMFGPVCDAVISAGAAVELLHNASLIHDDVIDESKLRRNAPTINSIWDNHIAVLVGDYFTTGAMQQAISTGDIRIIEALCKLGKKLSLGEIDQLYNAREHTLSEDNYYKVIDYKTASLFVASAEMGCLAMGVDDSRKEALSRYALLFGRCFQIRDDIFDYYDSATVGKPTGNDLREGKVSLPLLHALGLNEAPGRDHAAELILRDSLTDGDISLLQAFARDNGGIDYAFEAMTRLRSEAGEVLAPLPNCPEKKMLLDLFDFIIERKY